MQLYEEERNLSFCPTLKKYTIIVDILGDSKVEKQFRLTESLPEQCLWRDQCSTKRATNARLGSSCQPPRGKRRLGRLSLEGTRAPVSFSEITILSQRYLRPIAK